MIEIDASLLSKAALENLITEVITREGTEYGHDEYSLTLKIQQFSQKIASGLAVIVYSEKEQFCDIISRDAFQKLQLIETND